jgi:zinc protease
MRLCLPVSLTALLSLTAPAAEPVPPDKRIYAVVASKATRAHKGWNAAAEALAAKHRAAGKHVVILEYARAVTESKTDLAAWMPDFVCFVAPPEECGRDFVVHVHRMLRQLDADIYTDALWSILTGYVPEDAVRIAKRSEPLVIERGASGNGPGNVGRCKVWFGTAETWPKRFWSAVGGVGIETRVEPDVTEALVRGFNTMRPQVFFTSGHATDHDWQVGYRVKAGQFRHRGGQLYGVNTRGQAFKLTSHEPKVYLPAGNCLIGLVSGRDCMATSWMHTGGVYQMYGYTAVTWFGRMGWGTKARFSGGRQTLPEAFFWTNQDIVRNLHERYPQFAKVSFETYHQKRIGWLAGRHRVMKQNASTKKWEFWKDPMGLLWDRDCVAMYGDPAWDARFPRGESHWSEAWTEKGGTWTLSVTPREGTKAPGSFELWLPTRLDDVKLVDAGGGRAVVTDQFLMWSTKRDRQKGEAVRCVISGTPMVRPRGKPPSRAR